MNEHLAASPTSHLGISPLCEIPLLKKQKNKLVLSKYTCTPCSYVNNLLFIIEDEMNFCELSLNENRAHFDLAETGHFTS